MVVKQVFKEIGGRALDSRKQPWFVRSRKQQVNSRQAQNSWQCKFCSRPSAVHRNSFLLHITYIGAILAW